MTDEPQPLTAHLAELRGRLVKILLVWVVGTAIAWNFKEPIFQVLLGPAVRALGPHGGRLQALAPTEIFFTYLKGAALVGLVFGLPMIFWQIWAFIAPGLHSAEKRVAGPFVVVSTLLFLTGASFAYALVLPVMFPFLSSFQSPLVESAWTMREVFALTTRLLLVFGVAFELPVAIFFLSMTGIVEPRTLLHGGPYAVVLCFIAGAVLTPPDWMSQVVLSVPLVILYFAGVGAGYLVSPSRRKRREAARAGSA